MATKSPKKTTNKPSQHFYSVSIRKDGRKKDHSADTENAIREVENLAAIAAPAAGIEVKSDEQSLARLGIFFMKANESFAQQVKDLPQIEKVEKPAEKRPAAKRKRGKGR